MDLSEASIEDLMAEVQRRLDCQNKPEKRVILVGAFRFPSASISCAQPDPSTPMLLILGYL